MILDNKRKIILMMGAASSATTTVTFTGLFLLEDNSSHILLENGTDRLKGEG